MLYYKNFTEDQKLHHDAILKDGYLHKGEKDIFDIFKRVANSYGDNKEHTQRLIKYMSDGWFTPATPVLCNAGSKKRLPISCFLSAMQDTMDKKGGILPTLTELVQLTSLGGGVATDMSNLREGGSRIANGGKTASAVAWILAYVTAIRATAQGATRRGAVAMYCDVNHPDIKQFLHLRSHGGDPASSLNHLSDSGHIGVTMKDDFLDGVRNETSYPLISRANQEVSRLESAATIYKDILRTRHETGEPYMFFTDSVNDNIPDVYKKNGFTVDRSNLCSEVMLKTGLDNEGKNRIAVCCLSSLNIYTYDEWKDDDLFIEDVLRMLDNVLQDFIDRAPDSVSSAVHSAKNERAIGLGVMGLHSYLQSKLIAFDSEEGRKMDIDIFHNIRKKCDITNVKVALEKGACPDAERVGIMKRWSHTLATAPTETISYITGGVSPGILPSESYCFKKSNKRGSYEIWSPPLLRILKEKKEKKGFNIEHFEIYTKSGMDLNKINVKMGFPFSSQELKVFKSWEKHDQVFLMQTNALRQGFIDQGQSINIKVDPEITLEEFDKIHWTACSFGLNTPYRVKSLYYSRTTTVTNGLLSKLKVDQDCEVCQ